PVFPAGSAAGSPPIPRAVREPQAVTLPVRVPPATTAALPPAVAVICTFPQAVAVTSAVPPSQPQRSPCALAATFWPTNATRALVPADRLTSPPAATLARTSASPI